MNYSVVIPCYNEEKNIKQLIRQLDFVSGKLPAGCELEWILVENGSTDRTREKLEKYCQQRSGYKIVYVHKNHGYGYGVSQGIKASKGDYVGWLHADLQIDPRYIITFIKMAERLQEGEKAFFKGLRRNRCLSEYFFTNGMTVFASMILGYFMNDIGAVPVMTDRKLLESLRDIPNDFTMEVYIYWMAKKAGYTIKRTPVIVRKRKRGISSWNKGLISKIRFSMEVMCKICRMKKGYHVTDTWKRGVF